MKTKRLFLESTKLSDSYMVANIYKEPNYESVELKLSDCNRNITWLFGEPGKARGKRKIAKIKAFIDEVYNHIHQIEV